MVQFQLNNTLYQTPKGWQEVTFGKFLDYLSDVSPQMPEGLKEVFSSEDVEAEYNKLKANKKQYLPCIEYYSLCVSFWVNGSNSEIREGLNLEQLEQAFWTIQVDLNLNSLKEDVEFVGFQLPKKHGKETLWTNYLLPKRNMVGSTVAEFCDACHFEEKVEELSGGHWEALLDVMVVLCRPDGEHYDYNETKHNIRKKLFKKVTMDKVAQVGFFLRRLSEKLNQDLLIYSLAELIAQKEVEQLEKLMAGS